MKLIKLLHIADTHIGVENYGRLDTSTGLHTRLQDFVKSLESFGTLSIFFTKSPIAVVLWILIVISAGYSIYQAMRPAAK